MAEAVVAYILGKLAVYLLEKARELREVRGQIEQMQKDLRLIQAFLKNVDSKRNRDKLVKEWVNQVRDMAHKIEDVIDIYLVEIEEKRTKTFRSSTVADKFLKVGGELKEIMKNLNVIYQRRINLGISDLGAGSEENDQPAFRPAKPSDVDDSQVVGLDDDKCMIMNQLLDRDISRRTVLSILGTGGLGKTTLAQKIYKSAELEGQFDCLTWLSISQKFNLNNLLRDILYSIEPQMKDKNPPVSDEVILEKLKSSLGCKRYLIVLDDVWTIELWERMKLALPDANKASRVIITTRLLDVAKAADCNTKPYKLHYLSDAEGLALLFRNTFQEDVQPENHPHLLEVAKRLTKKCGGLPLALVVLGSILRTRDRTYYAWSKVEDTMDWHDKDGEKCMKILALSYKDLPHYLKPCFLYFASFPANHKILGKHVTRMWLAEGFVPKDGAGTMEDRADEFLEELVHRCLIEVTKKSWNGYCKYCSMHGLLRDLAIHVAKEENFFTVFSNAQGVNQLAARKPRRAALQFCTLTKDGVYSKNTRTLLCFDSNDSGFKLLDYSGFRLLRVLTLEKVDMSKLEQRQWPNNLVHLRYLGLRKCTIPQEIFKKIFFYNLETLDLKDSELLPKQVTKNWSDIIIPTLRHVYGSIYIRRCLPLKWDHHTNLQTVKDVVLQREVAKLGCCINLRTLGISYQFGLTNEMALKEWANLKGVLSKTKQLVYLGITTTGLLPFGGTIDLPCHENIQKLHLDGIWVRNICVLSVEMFPTNLTKLTLQLSGLEEDVMPILERLQSLRILHLDSDSYVGTEMICSTGGFPNLEKLKLVMLPNLCHWDIKERAMPILTHIVINDCNELHTLPKLQNVRTLQELLVIWPSRELHESMQEKDLHKIEHIPSVRIRSN